MHLTLHFNKMKYIISFIYQVNVSITEQVLKYFLVDYERLFYKLLIIFADYNDEKIEIKKYKG